MLYVYDRIWVNGNFSSMDMVTLNFHYDNLFGFSRGCATDYG